MSASNPMPAIEAKTKFEYIKPDTYYARLFIDENGNEIETRENPKDFTIIVSRDNFLKSYHIKEEEKVKYHSVEYEDDPYDGGSFRYDIYHDDLIVKTLQKEVSKNLGLITKTSIYSTIIFAKELTMKMIN